MWHKRRASKKRHGEGGKCGCRELGRHGVYEDGEEDLGEAACEQIESHGTVVEPRVFWLHERQVLALPHIPPELERNGREARAGAADRARNDVVGRGCSADPHLRVNVQDEEAHEEMANLMEGGAQPQGGVEQGDAPTELTPKGTHREHFVFGARNPVVGAPYWLARDRSERLTGVLELLLGAGVLAVTVKLMEAFLQVAVRS